MMTGKESRLDDVLELIKMRLVSLVLLSAAVGYYIAPRNSFDLSKLILTMLGTALVAAGSMALNEWWERADDARMKRTAARPLPSGRISEGAAIAAGVILSAVGLLLLFFKVNAQACILSAATLISYILIYTPLKKVTSLCTLVGAVPGALPPMIGWAGAVGGWPAPRAWVLFCIVFIWQMPHFLAIAWMHRKDYGEAGFKMLSVEDPSGHQVGRQILLYSLALLPVTLLPPIFDMTGKIYFYGALLLGVSKIGLVLWGLPQMDARCRVIFRASLAHLSFLLLLMFLNKV